MRDYMIKTAFCPRCGRHMNMMIPFDEEHPTCLSCIEKSLGRHRIPRGLLAYLASLGALAGGIIFLLII